MEKDPGRQVAQKQNNPNELFLCVGKNVCRTS